MDTVTARINKMCEDGKKRLIITLPRKKIARSEEPYMKPIKRIYGRSAGNMLWGNR